MARLCNLHSLESGLARADGCPVAPPRSGLSIQHPCRPKSVCRCISIAIQLRTRSLNFKLHGLYLVFTCCLRAQRGGGRPERRRGALSRCCLAHGPWRRHLGTPPHVSMLCGTRPRLQGGATSTRIPVVGAIVRRRNWSDPRAAVQPADRGCRCCRSGCLWRRKRLCFSGVI